MLYYHNRVVVLFKNSHELKDCECSANLQCLEAAVKAAQDRGEVATGIYYSKPLKLEVVIENLDEHLSEA